MSFRCVVKINAEEGTVLNSPLQKIKKNSEKMSYLLK